MNDINDLITNKVRARARSEDPTSFVQTEEAPLYIGSAKQYKNDNVIKQAIDIINHRLMRSEVFNITCPNDTKNYLVLKLAEREHEVFAVMFLDYQHHLIKYEEMFRGTIDDASVYPREVVKRALQLNAAALIVAHNHPSGVPEPSNPDKKITHRLKEACNLVEIRLLDHVIIGCTDTVSLAERGVL